MPIRLSIALAVSLLVLGASYAFADGILNDAEGTRARGGVGNYLFWSMRDAPFQEEKNELVNSETAFEREPELMPVEELTIRQSSAIAPIRTVTFPQSSARITGNQKSHLDEIAETLKSDPELKAQITGYSDSSGSAMKNQALSRARAQSVAQGLRERGVGEEQISWNGKGESDPVSENSSPEGRAQNRRVEVQFE